MLGPPAGGRDVGVELATAGREFAPRIAAFWGVSDASGGVHGQRRCYLDPMLTPESKRSTRRYRANI